MASSGSYYIGSLYTTSTIPTLYTLSLHDALPISIAFLTRMGQLRLIVLIALVATPVSATLTASLSPSATVGVTNTYLVGTASPGATVTETKDGWADGRTPGT